MKTIVIILIPAHIAPGVCILITGSTGACTFSPSIPVVPEFNSEHLDISPTSFIFFGQTFYFQVFKMWPYGYEKLKSHSKEFFIIIII